jgi:pyruvate ferredoxin oxidoreductase gamma subunit
VYRIRFHGRGGQGMKTASRILGTAFFMEGFEVQDAPRYGAERRGAPIFAYVRASRAPINERGVIRCPDLVIVADETLLRIPAAGVLAGVDGHTVLLVITSEDVDTWRERLNFPGTLLCLPEDAEGVDRIERTFIGAACAGAAARLVGIVSREALDEAISLELSKRGEAIVRKNLAKALDAYELMASHAGIVSESGGVPATDYIRPQWVDVPFEEARYSAPLILAAATSERVKTGLWRTMRPVIDRDKCNRCWWVCSTLCPDGTISVDEEGYPRIDYEHCKGCLICAAQCTSHAIFAVPEHEAAAADSSAGGRS